MTIEQFIPIIINLTILVFFIWANTVVRQRLKSQDDIIAKMKSFMDIFKIDEVKKFVDVREETMKLKLENEIAKHSKEFAKNSEPYIRNILDKEVAKITTNINGKYDEMANFIYDIILRMPIADRPDFINDVFKNCGADFIRELKDDNEWQDI